MPGNITKKNAKQEKGRDKNAKPGFMAGIDWLKIALSK